MPSLAEPTDWRAWAQHVHLNLAELRPYAQAVYASTEEYLNALPEDALDQPYGETPACVLNALLLTLSMRRGEISCLGSACTAENKEVSPQRVRVSDRNGYNNRRLAGGC
jgi:hypothetical protein